MPADARGQNGRHELAEERPGVDAHVEDRETGVSPCTTFRVQITHECRNVRLEKTGTEHDEDEPEEEHRFPREEPGQSDRQMSACDEHAAEEDRAAKPENAIRYPATRQRREVH